MSALTWPLIAAERRSERGGARASVLSSRHSNDRFFVLVERDVAAVFRRVDDDDGNRTDRECTRKRFYGKIDQKIVATLNDTEV